MITGKSDLMRRYAWRARKWARYATGKSLHNVPQGLGRAYVPGRLEGYFNDLTGKTKWSGSVDDRGVPVVETDRGNRFSFPITVFQKGLGHWDNWLLSGQSDETEATQFLTIADWAVDALDERGGWPCWSLLNRGTVSPYSSMAQGQGVSVLVRAHALTGRPRYQEAAATAGNGLADLSSPLGIIHRDADGLWMEEYPGSRMRAVLNGWMFSLMGLQDLLLMGASHQVRNALDETLNTLACVLIRYDCGYWSMYDLGGTIASPFYHVLHVAQLRALADTFEPVRMQFSAMADRWATQSRNPVAYTRALSLKVSQKLRDTNNEEFS